MHATSHIDPPHDKGFPRAGESKTYRSLCSYHDLPDTCSLLREQRIWALGMRWLRGRADSIMW